MSLVVKQTGNGNYTPPPAGTHRAICVQIIDLGTQYSKFYDKESHKVLIGWELVDEQTDTGENFLIWNRYTASLHENAALRQHLENWRGRAFTDEELDGFSLRNILDKPCLLSVVHSKEDSKTYANVKGVMALPKAQRDSMPNRTHDLVEFDFDDPSQNVFATFSENLQKTILSSPEGKASGLYLSDSDTHGVDRGDKPGAPIDEDDVPF